MYQLVLFWIGIHLLSEINIQLSTCLIYGRVGKRVLDSCVVQVVCCLNKSELQLFCSSFGLFVDKGYVPLLDGFWDVEEAEAFLSVFGELFSCFFKKFTTFRVVCRDFGFLILLNGAFFNLGPWFVFALWGSSC